MSHLNFAAKVAEGASADRAVLLFTWAVGGLDAPTGFSRALALIHRAAAMTLEIGAAQEWAWDVELPSGLRNRPSGEHVATLALIFFGDSTEERRAGKAALRQVSADLSTMGAQTQRNPHGCALCTLRFGACRVQIGGQVVRVCDACAITMPGA